VKCNSGKGPVVRMGGRTGCWTSFVLFSGILLGAAAGLHAQGVRYDNIVLGPRGGPVASATVAVCAAGATTSTTSCSPLATVYSDEGLTQPMANPFQADSLGNYGFWAAPGHYVVQIYGTGVSTRVMNVFLPCDPSNCSMANATFSSITAGTLNLTGALTVNGRSVATEPKAGDAVMYVSPNGSDSNDGLSWGTAKQTLYAAVSALETTVMNGGWNGGTLYVADNASCGGPVSGQGLWLYRNTSSPGSGWIKMNSTLNIVGVGTTHWGANSPGPQIQLNCGSATEPALQLTAINAPLRIANLIFGGSVGANINGSSTIVFDNDTFGADSSVATNGPAVFVGASSFWLYFRHCTFQANGNAGKATDGSDATEAFVVNPGASNASSGLIFINQSVENSGDVKYYSGSTSASLFVDGLSSENQTDGKGAVWITGAAGDGLFDLRDVTVSDATQNPTPAVEVDAGIARSTLVAGAQGVGLNVIGPATILSQYSNNVQNETEIPYAQGQEGVIDGRLWAQSDNGRRMFSPVASRFQNLASQIPSYWSNSGITISNVAAPDGTNNAGEATNSNTSQGNVPFFNGNLSISNGDYLIGGAWVRSANGTGGYAGGAAVEVGVQCSGVTLTSLTPQNPSYIGQNYIQTGRSGEWEWWSFADKVSGLSTSPSTCYTPMAGQVSPNGGKMDFFAPVLYHVPAGTISDSEASYVAMTLASYPDGLNPPVEATLRGHPFAFGGSGDNYFATLDHTALTANRTYLFPDRNGTVALALSGTTATIGGSALAAGACTTGTAAISGASTSMAVAVSPSADPGTGFSWEGWVSGTGAVTVRLCNVSGASATPAAVTYNVRVIE
jgi:hypothetical protein